MNLMPWRERGGLPTRGTRDPVSAFRSEMDRLFDDFFSASGLPSMLRDESGRLTPRMEIAETEQAYEVTAELPGVKESDVDVSFADGVLTISGEKKSENEAKGNGWVRSERAYGSFRRSLALPPDVDPERIDASFRDGVLKVTAAKSAEAANSPRKIPVKGNGGN